MLALPMGLAMRAFGRLEETPAIPDDDDDDPTPSATEGPYFKRKSPERASLLENGVTGTTLIISGRALTSDGKPISGALLDFWQCDANGDYDNKGFKLRGHQFTDKDGNYKLETVWPGVYTGRARHVHVKAQAPNGRILTTQLFFPDEEGNKRDGIFDKRLLMKVSAEAEAKKGSFDFVLRA